MSRDEGLEELMRDDLQGERGLVEKPLFGGWCWLVGGNLLCGARDDGMLVRLGKGNDGWALKISGIAPMTVGKRSMPGWVWADADVFGDDALRRKLLDAALAYVRTLPKK